MSDGISLGVEVTMRGYHRDPMEMALVPLGGREPVILMTFDLSKPDLVDMKMDATGFRDQNMLLDVLSSLVKTMQTMPYTLMNGEGVERHEGGEH